MILDTHTQSKETSKPLEMMKSESEVAQSCPTLIYSAIKKNEIMPFAAIWMDLETIILSEVSQRKTNIT